MIFNVGIQKINTVFDSAKSILDFNVANALENIHILKTNIDKVNFSAYQ